MTFTAGSLVKARGREWVVQPESEGDLLVLRPLSGSEIETAGVHAGLETVETASFDWPRADGDLGDFHSCRRLRDAARITNRQSAGPFRSAGNLNVEPRPYQLVPLLLALRQDPVRLLLADDVGIGKTVEACLIARELVDRGEIRRLCVLCPPHLAEQWQDELRRKFNLPAERLLPSTARRLEREAKNLRVGGSLFDSYPYLVISTDYIKSDRRRDEFLRAAPGMVVVDEAHTCVPGSVHARTAHQRHQLLRGLADDAERHLVLVTATPHSGKEEAFRSLLGLLSPELRELPEDLSGKEHEKDRRLLSRYLVQRRRGDIEDYLGETTPFPERRDADPTYSLHPDYRKFFDKVLAFARETVHGESGDPVGRRVRWWSALALLRSVASSPAAAAATLRSRSRTAAARTPEEADELGRRAVLDLTEEDGLEGTDVIPGSDPSDADPEADAEADAEVDAAADSDTGDRRLRDRLRRLAREAEALGGAKDRKVQGLVEHVRELREDGFRPIVFCRFIPTVEYVVEHLRRELPGGAVAGISGLQPPEVREARVLELAESDRPVLVCTDCLSEGINLQQHFDAVIHYDLSWSPTRHEQREGRVDRFGQRRDEVRVLTYYGSDNPIDGIVLDVLLRKHQAIRRSTGVAVPVPSEGEKVVEAIFEGLLLREEGGRIDGDQMALFEDLIQPQRQQFHRQWEERAEHHKKQSQTMFAQRRIHPEVVEEELEAARRAVGSGRTVREFTLDALRAYGAHVVEGDPHRIDLSEALPTIRDLLPVDDAFAARFDLPVEEGVLYLHRTHDLVKRLAGQVFDAALDPELEGIARRAGVLGTGAVDERTVLLLTRMRFELRISRGDETTDLLAEDCGLVAFRGHADDPEPLADDEALALLDARPDASVGPDRARHHLRSVLADREDLQAYLDLLAEERARELLDAHRRVREAAKAKGLRYEVSPRLPVDVLGLYLYLPAGSGS